jgi:type I restriction enzyme, S subunit
LSQVWKRQPIAALAKHNLGKMLDRAKNRGELKPYLRNLNVRWFNFDLSDVLEMRFEADEVERYTIRKGDLVICEGGYPGRAAVWESDDSIYFQKALHRVRFHQPVYARWCLYYLWYEDALGLLRANFNGAGIQHFTGESLAKFEIPAPPVGEASRIVAILDEAFDRIATAKVNAEKNLQNARELFESFLDAALARHEADSVEVTLGNEIELLAGYAFSSKGYMGAVNGVRLLRGDNIMQGYLRWDDAKYWSADDLVSYARFALKEGDVVLAMDRPWVKAGLKRAQICEEDLPCLQLQRTARLRPKKRMRLDFLFHLVGSRSFSQHLLGVQTGLGVPHISGKQIEGFQFMLPSMSEQSAIASALDELKQQTDRLEAVCEQKISALDELKKSLLHQAFTGQL